MFEFIGGIVTGIFLFVGYGAYRATKSDGWDDSNVLNWLRLLSHCFIHPEDFAKVYFLTELQYKGAQVHGKVVRPFGYVGKDEFSQNFPESRP